MSALIDLTVTDLIKGLQGKEFSSVEVTQAYLDQMAARRDLNAFVTETPEIALAQAKAADELIAKGEGGALNGVPMAVKDMFCTQGVRTTASSKMLENFVPDYESTVTQQLFDQGAVMLGKVSLDEFAMGASNMTSHFGPVINPWRSKSNPGQDLVPGGSSGGSAAAVAAKLAPFALGTDTNGSVRQPASFCGLVGVKPTYGRCSRWGIVAFASSLDQAGVLGRTVADTASTLQVMSGYDPKDSTSAKRDVPDWTGQLTGDLKGLKVGVPRSMVDVELPADIQATWERGIEWLKAAGAEIVDIELPNAKYSIAAYYIIAPAEASSNLARYDGVRYGHRAEEFEDLTEMYQKTRAEGFGDEVKRRILIGTYALSAGYYDAYYIKAQKVRRLIAQDFDRAFEKCDAILAPSSAGAAFPLGEKMDDPVKMYLEDIFTSPASMAGIPALSVPAGFNDDGLPLGLQVMTQRWEEGTMFNVAQAIEEAAGFKGL